MTNCFLPKKLKNVTNSLFGAKNIFHSWQFSYLLFWVPKKFNLVPGKIKKLGTLPETKIFSFCHISPIFFLLQSGKCLVDSWAIWNLLASADFSWSWKPDIGRQVFLFRCFRHFPGEKEIDQIRKKVDSCDTARVQSVRPRRDALSTFFRLSPKLVKPVPARNQIKLFSLEPCWHFCVIQFF